MSEQLEAQLRAYLDNPAPTEAESYEVFAPLTEGSYDPLLVAALLATIRTRGATPADITGAARAFLEKATPFPQQGEGLIDCVGTGGDGANTINISTAASLVAASAGLRMVKHGNRSVSSKSGSADVLEAFGINLMQEVDQAHRQLQGANFTFLFAPAYHPAFKHVMPIRQALKIPTIFNVLGPLINPARPEIQLLGVADPALGPLMIRTLADLGRTRALVVHGSGIDEIAVHGSTQVWELRDGEITSYTLTPSDFGVGEWTLEDLRGGTGEENAALLRAVFEGAGAPAHRDAIVANAGALFYLAGQADSFAEGAELAAKQLSSGTVSSWLSAQEAADYSRPGEGE